MPTPIADKALDDSSDDVVIANNLEVRGAIKDGRVTLVPIVATAPMKLASFDYVTLDEGMKSGAVTVREMPEFDVGTVTVSNTSSQPLFVMSGELIWDGHQDRMFAETRVIQAHHTEQVSVNCVELGRDAGGHAFHRSHLLVELPLRQMVRYGTQQRVWDTVASINSRLNLAPQTQTYRYAAQRQDSGDAAKRRDHLVHELEAAPEHEQFIGMAIAYDGEIVAIDRFANHALFAKLAPELIGSYITGEDGKPREGNQPTAAVIRAFITRGAEAASTASSETMLKL